MKAVHLLAIGSFGRAVAAVLTTMLDCASVAYSDDATVVPVVVSDAALTVVLAGRPVPAITTQVDERSFAGGTSWLPVTVHGTVLRIGPLVVPGRGACHRCFERRMYQHSPHPAVDRAVAEHFRGYDADEPYGHLPGTAAFAAGVTADVVERAPEGAGRVRQRDLVTSRLTSGQVVGVHGCDRCGLHRDERSRSTVDLRGALEGMLSWTS